MLFARCQKQAECRKKMFCLLCAKKKAHSVEALSMFPEKAIKGCICLVNPLKLTRQIEKFLCRGGSEMITQANIIHFYNKYKENLDKEEQVLEGLLQADDQEVWIENMKKKSGIMRRLYIENEALLNLYIRPFLDGEVKLDDTLAEELLHQIRTADRENYEDELVMNEVTEMLEKYFKKQGMLDQYIWTLNLLGGFYNRVSSAEIGKQGAAYFDRIRSLSSHYFEIEDFEVRKRIIYSFYNYPIVTLNFNMGTPEEILESLDRALAFYTDEKVRALDGERFDFDGLIEELNYDLLGNSVMKFDKEHNSPVLLERGGKSAGSQLSGTFKRESQYL